VAADEPVVALETAALAAAAAAAAAAKRAKSGKCGNCDCGSNNECGTKDERVGIEEDIEEVGQARFVLPIGTDDECGMVGNSDGMTLDVCDGRR
jgi:hypothetical protein